MKCPVCDTTDLMMTERQGVEIDYCPKCRGVWLDRGELDKIIERSAPQESSAQHPPQYAPPPQAYLNGHAPKYGHGDSHGYKPHHKKSFLQELFD